MHKLTRSEAPDCLSQYKHGRDKWSSVTDSHKGEIWQRLNQMQHQCCAYCECNIAPIIGNAHIEHFRQRASHLYPQGAFEWNNIFGSCNRLSSCGKYKDSAVTYAYQDLIKMDEEDPEDLLLFLPDGSVTPRSNLSSNGRRRAEETIRIFNLNGALRQIRYNEIQGYQQTAEDLAFFREELSEEEWYSMLDDELEAIQQLPFSTAIKHLLLSNLL